MPRPVKLIEWIFFIALAGAFALFGAGIPVHFKAVAPAVLAEAAKGKETVSSLAEYNLDNGKVGVVEQLWSSDPRLSGSGGYRHYLNKLMEDHPNYWVTGGPSPYFEAFIDIIGFESEKYRDYPVMRILLKDTHRAELLGFLEESSNSGVAALLKTRELSNTQLFMPVYTSAGRPLDASILMSAMLMQEQHFSPEVNKFVKRLAEDATHGEDYAAADLESLYLALMTLGSRMNWIQLAELVEHCQSPRQILIMATYLQRYPDKLPQLYTLMLLTSDIESVARYLEKFPEKGWDAVQECLFLGSGAVELLVEKRQPLYQPPKTVELLNRPLNWIQSTPLLGFTHRHPKGAFILKFISFFLAGYCVALGFRSLIHAFMRKIRVSRFNIRVIMVDAFMASFITGIVWVVMEPALLIFDTKTDATLQLDFQIVTHLSSLKSQNIMPTHLDQITIITLIMFFVLQLSVYFIGLTKMLEIRRREVSPDLKLKLLENEENLFELGLYVGLGGTVGSLILLVMDIVQASLLAAYASTLFGIIFVAILKVVNLRPLRRKLILEREQANSDES